MERFAGAVWTLISLASRLAEACDDQTLQPIQREGFLTTQRGYLIVLFVFQPGDTLRMKVS